MQPAASDPFNNALNLINRVQVLTGVPAVEVSTTGFIIGMVFRAVRLAQQTMEASQVINATHDGLVRLQDVIGQPLVNAPDQARLRIVFRNLSNQTLFPDLFAALEHERQDGFRNGPNQGRALWRLAVAWRFMRPVVNEGRFDLPVLNEQLGQLLARPASPEKYKLLLDSLEHLLPEDAFSVNDLVNWSRDRFAAQLRQQLGILATLDEESKRELEEQFRALLAEAVNGPDGALPAALARMKEKHLEGLNAHLTNLQAELAAIEPADSDDHAAKQAEIDALTAEIARVTAVDVTRGL
jgi:hypothetical protein